MAIIAAGAARTRAVIGLSHHVLRLDAELVMADLGAAAARVAAEVARLRGEEQP